MEVACSTCGGRLRAETPGIVVECPHCQTHLQIPQNEENAEVATAAAVEPETAQADTPAVGSEVVSAADLTDSFTGETENPLVVDDTSAPPTEKIELPAGFPFVETDSAQPAGEDASPAPFDIQINTEGSTEQIAAPPAEPDVPNWTPPEDDAPAFAGALPAVDVGVVSVSAGDAPDASSVPAAETAAADASSAATASAPRSTNGAPVVSRLLFLIVVGYASAITIALIVVWFYYQRSKQLNLPDVVPQQTAEGKISFNYYAEDAVMPSGHRLQLGETQRFGYLEITALKVTQGPVLIADEYGEDPSLPVLKLWLKIKNVSDNQTFAPFGRTLARTRSRQHNRANVFVCRADQKRRDGDKVFMYDLDVEETQIALKGQNIDRALKPGESYNTFLATDEEGIDSLKGDLVWRVHVRKGYNPVSKWGITTLFEINFHRDQVKTESQSG